MNTEELLNQRETTHGAFKHHAFCTQLLKTVISNTLDMSKAELSYQQQEAVDMICHKLGRIAAGNPDTKDHWDDIAGYSSLVSRELVEDYDDKG